MTAPHTKPRAWEAPRRAEIEFDHSYLPTPLHWKLRLWGQSVGGYGVLKGANPSRHATRDDAEAVAAIWIETGLTPAFQTEDRIAAARAANNPIRIEEAA